MGDVYILMFLFNISNTWGEKKLECFKILVCDFSAVLSSLDASLCGREQYRMIWYTCQHHYKLVFTMTVKVE